MPPRKLTREGVLDTAVAMADAEGLGRLTMRRLAGELGVEAMSLYHHVANKDALLDGMVDRVYDEVVLPDAAGDWRAELRRRSVSVRQALTRHPWALPLMESRRAPGPATLAYHDANIACLRAAGFTPEHVAHAYAVVDAFVYGFVLQETTLPFDSGPEAAEFVSAGPLAELIAAYPHMAWFAEHVVLAPGYTFGREFEPGLDLVLDGVAALLP
jgi:AcrR family transcriptional regulator